MTTQLLLQNANSESGQNVTRPRPKQFVIISSEGGGGKSHAFARLQQLQSIAAGGGDNAECANADLFREFGSAFDTAHP